MEGNEIGKNIVSLRKKNNISQAEFASRIHVSPSTLCRWEKGSVVPSLESINCICVEFNISKAELIEGNEISESKKKSLFHMPKKILCAAMIILIIVCFYILCPGYRVIDETEVHQDIYGKTITLCVAPNFLYNHKKAERYAEKIGKQYLTTEKIDAVEVIIVNSQSNLLEVNDSDEVFIYLN